LKSDVIHNRFFYRFTQIFITRLFKLLFGLRIEGRINVPEKGAFILASNHQSWFDPPIIGSACPREICFAAKKELFKTPILGTLVRYYNSIPVNRSGFDRAALKSLGQALENERGIIIFPEGTRYLDGKLHSPKAGVGMMAVNFDVPIVPIYISGTIKIRRQLLRRSVRVIFGSPFRLSDAGLENAKGKEGYHAVADEVMRRIAKTGGVKAPSN
jgi:1-acyl-sn-glycerol-3-phosphate acyltransferase